MILASRQIAESESGNRRQILAANFNLAANIPFVLNLSANSSLKFFGAPRGCVINSTSTDVLAIVSSTGHAIQTSKNYNVFSLFAIDGDSILLLSKAGATVNLILTDYEIDPVSF